MSAEDIRCPELLKLRMVLNHHVGAGNRTHVFFLQVSRGIWRVQELLHPSPGGRVTDYCEVSAGNWTQVLFKSSMHEISPAPFLFLIHILRESQHVALARVELTMEIRLATEVCLPLSVCACTTTTVTKFLLYVYVHIHPELVCASTHVHPRTSETIHLLWGGVPHDLKYTN